MSLQMRVPKTEEQLKSQLSRAEGYMEALEFAYEATESKIVKLELLEQIKKKEQESERIKYRLQRMKEVNEAKSS